LEASALTHASRRGLLARRSPLLKLQGDEKLIAMARAGNPGAFEAIVDRYQGRLLGFCRQMLNSTEDAEDVLQEVFVNAYRAMLADEREINLRPWLYRIARNRCLNYLRKPKADAQESMDMVPEVDAASTAEKVHNREEFRQILSDVNKLPETQRAALLLREMDALSYEEIAAAMDTTVPSVKSLLVRARISLAEASQARLLTCGEVRIELSEAAEGLRKASAPVRRHVRECDECADFRSQIRSTEKALAALSPIGPLLALKGFFLSKLGLGGAGGAGAGATGAGAAGAGAGAVGSVGAAAAISGSSAAGGLSALGGALGTKAVAGVVTAAVLTAGAVEVKQTTMGTPVDPSPTAAAKTPGPTIESLAGAETAPVVAAHAKQPAVAAVAPTEAPPVPAPVAVEEEPAAAPVPAEEEGEEAAGASAAGEEATVATAEGSINAAKPSEEVAGAHGGSGTVVVSTSPSSPPTESTAPPAGEPSSPPPSSSPPVIEVTLPPVPVPAPETTPPAGEAE
jgi:RNA polymerase sigma factor (sigma-70 family)